MGRTAWRLTVAVATIVAAYVAIAYLLMPTLWHRYAERHPSLDSVPGITQTASGIPGDPLNVALVGTEAEVKALMAAAKWSPADPLSLSSDIEIAADTVLERPYADAPVSSLYLRGRKEDLAFEQPVGNDPKERHHVRFWRSDVVEPDGRSVWLGSATFDTKVELSSDDGTVHAPHLSRHRRRARSSVRNAEANRAACRSLSREGIPQGSRRPEWRRRPLAHRRDADGRFHLPRRLQVGACFETEDAG